MAGSLRARHQSAQIAKGIDIPHAELIIRKGFHNDVDSYSAFLEADKETKTGSRELPQGTPDRQLLSRPGWRWIL